MAGSTEVNLLGMTFVTLCTSQVFEMRLMRIKVVELRLDFSPATLSCSSLWHFKQSVLSTSSPPFIVLWQDVQGILFFMWLSAIPAALAFRAKTRKDDRHRINSLNFIGPPYLAAVAAACWPAILPNTKLSIRAFPPARFVPWIPPVVSPAA